MKWNHREIVKEATMQAKLYGMVVENTGAGFSSRYLASTGVPGVRCRRLTKDNFEGGLPKPYVVSELEWMLGNSKDKDLSEKQNSLTKIIRLGMWVPWSGGEMFATINNDRKVHLVHADINAAQNLQRRFWNRCGEAFRITCKASTIDGIQCYELDRPPGLRLLGALQKMGNSAVEFYLNDESGKQQYVMRSSGKKKKRIKAGEKDDSFAEDEFAEAIVELEEEGKETFFRDPSGILFASKHWVPSKVYWPLVRKKVWTSLKNQ